MRDGTPLNNSTRIFGCCPLCSRIQPCLVFHLDITPPYIVLQTHRASSCTPISNARGTNTPHSTGMYVYLIPRASHFRTRLPHAKDDTSICHRQLSTPQVKFTPAKSWCTVVTFCVLVKIVDWIASGLPVRCVVFGGQGELLHRTYLF